MPAEYHPLESETTVEDDATKTTVDTGPDEGGATIFFPDKLGIGKATINNQKVVTLTFTIIGDKKMEPPQDDIALTYGIDLDMCEVLEKGLRVARGD